ncbi:MAG: DUF4342 domain-containing protein [Anaerolineae bacterium]|jgi:hypothetical protein|nr:DUF4342 domain-containing protein [Anaerolineae bacterium]
MSDDKRKNDGQQTWTEELEVKGRDLVERVKELIEQGNVRRLVIRKKDGDVLMEVPLTASVIAGSALLVFAPLLAAIGALAALVTEVRLEVVRDVDGDDKKKVDIE